MSEPSHAAAPPGKTKGTLTIPGIGKLPVWAVLGGVGIVVVLIIRSRSSSSAAAGTAAAAGEQTDPAGNVGTIDPATGYVYGSDEDQAALAAQASDDTGTGDGSDGSVSDQVSAGPPFTSNAAWSQYAITVLEGNGYDAGTLTSELGLYLAGQPVTAIQSDDINAAVGVAGYPPVAGPNGYPPAINVSGSVTSPTPPASGGGTTTGTPTGTTTTTSPTAPKTGAPITATPVNLKTDQVSATSVQVSWLAPTIPAGQGPLAGYGAECYESASGQPVGNGAITLPAGQTYLNVGSLKSKTAYHIDVWCDPAKTGGPHATVSFTTKS